MIRWRGMEAHVRRIAIPSLAAGALLGLAAAADYEPTTAFKASEILPAELVS